MKFEDLLHNIEKPSLDEVSKSNLKSRILSHVGFESDFLCNVQMDENRKFVLKEKIMDLILMRPQRQFLLQRFFLFQKKFISFALIFVMTFGFLSFVNVDTSVVRASSLTVLDNLLGHVLVERDGKSIEAYNGMQLYVDDVIITGRQASCDIKYFDDSVSRLKNSTELHIKELKNFYGFQSKTYVEVEILNGIVWSKVLNLVDDSSFVVEVDDVFTRAKKAAFNVSYQFDELEVEVFNNVVEIHRPDKVNNVKKIITGHKVKVDTKRDLVVEEIKDVEKGSDWVVQNLAEDKNYIVEVENKKLDEKKKIIAYDDSKDFDFNDSFRTEAMLMLTFDDVDKKKKELDILEQKFIASELNLRDENLDSLGKVELEAQIFEFKDAVENYYAFIDEVSVQDSKYAEELKKNIDDKLLLYKKDLSLVLPDSPAYVAKNVVDGLLNGNTTNKEILISQKVDQAQSKLDEVEELIVVGKTDYVDGTMKDYESDMNDVVKIMKELEDENVVSGDVDVPNYVEKDMINTIADLETKKDSLELQLQVEKNLNVEPDVSNSLGTAILEKLSPDYTKVESGNFGVQIHGDKPVSPILNY